MKTKTQKIFVGIFSLFLLIAVAGVVSAQEDVDSSKEAVNPPIDCISWFDGCNTCEVEEGEIVFCTKKGCVEYQEPKCLEYSEEIVKAGAKPGSALYGLDRAMENIRMAFTFNKAKKANYGLKIAEERLAEAKELSEKGEEERAQIAVENHERIMKKVQKNIEGLESNGDNETSQKTLGETYSLEEKLQKHRQKVTEVHSGILEKLRNESNMSEEQIQHLEKVFGKIENNSLGVENKILEKREQAKMKYKVVSGQDSDEIEAEFEDREKNIEKTKEAVKNRIRERNEISNEVRQEILEKINDSEEFKNLSEEEKQELKENIRSKIRENTQDRIEKRQEIKEEVKDEIQETLEDSLEENESEVSEKSSGLPLKKQAEIVE